MKTMRPLLLSFSLIAFAGAAFAADTQHQGMQQSTSGGSSMKSQSGSTLAVSKLQDMKVVGRKGEDIGQVSDVVLNLANRRVHAVVVESGGTFGIGGDNYAFPMKDFTRGKESDQLVLNVTKQQLENKRGFAKSQWPGMNEKYWSEVDRTGAAGATARSGGTNLVRASELEGKQVQGKGGEEVGELKDVTIGLNDGHLRNVVIDVEDGGQVAIPARQLSSGTDDRLVVAMDAQQIRSQAKKSAGSKASSGATGKPQQQKY